MAGRSQRDVARKGGVSATAIGNYLLGRLPDLNDTDLIHRLAVCMDVTEAGIEEIVREDLRNRSIEAATRALAKEPDDLIRKYVQRCRGVIDREHMEAAIRQILDEELNEPEGYEPEP